LPTKRDKNSTKLGGFTSQNVAFHPESAAKENMYIFEQNGTVIVFLDVLFFCNCQWGYGYESKPWHNKP
jgi:hypothetical protein